MQQSWQALHAFNPKGIVSSSPGLRGTSYPGAAREQILNPEGVLAATRLANKNPSTVSIRVHPRPSPLICIIRGLALWLRRRSAFVSVLSLTLCFARAQDQPKSNGFFLPQNPVAAAYVLGRLSNRELIEAPRGEFVYIALLLRKGLDRKYRVEALQGLTAIRHTSQTEELLKGLVELDRKPQDSESSSRDLASILLQSNRSELTARRIEIGQLALHSQVPFTREIAWAALLSADGSLEPSWSQAKASPPQLEDLLLGLPLVPDTALRAEAYPKVKPLLLSADPPGLCRAAIVAIAALPGHDLETFKSLAALVQAGVETPTAIRSLARIPQSTWPKEDLALLSQSLLDNLKKATPQERADSPFTDALQFATEVASLLPPDVGRPITRALQSLGPTIVTLHAIYEQMRFDKNVIVVSIGKPVVLILQNDDAMPHNLAVLAPGALKEIGLMAEKMSPEPDSEGRLYVPASPKVLHATKLTGPGQKVQLAFDAPAESGDYPFVCTFPGHWLRMSGTLTVTVDVDAYLASHPLSQQPKMTEWKLADFSSDLPRAGLDRNLPVGKEFFSKLACVQCHKLGSQGYSYGPDLTDVFKRYKDDRGAVLQQILEPSKVIDDRYRNYNFELKSGDPVVGMILKEDDQSLTIQTGPADSLIQVLKKSEILRRQPQPSSPMPVGLLNALSETQIFDLLAFLESGGQVPSHVHPH